MRVLLIGASGQLGTALHAVFAAKYEVVAAGFRHAGAGQLVVDLGDPDSVRSALVQSRPSLVLVAGAQANVDLCETEVDRTMRVNVEGPRAIARYAREHDGWVVYYSTDHVFDGTKDHYTETDPVSPLNVYARSKVEGEAAVASLLPERHIILRSSWIYGPDRERRNFPVRLADRLRAGESVTVPVDQIGCPTYTEDLAVATQALVDRGASGTFHGCGPEAIDRMTLACRICRRFELPEGRLAGAPTSALGQAAPRPRRVVLDCAKLAAAAGVRFRDVDEGLAALAAAGAVR